MKAIALDDEPLALLVLRELVKEIPGVDLLATFTNANAAEAYLKENVVDLLFLDINMPDITGIEFIKLLDAERPSIIFMTAHKNFALDAFDLDVIDYLVKPVQTERFQQAVDKAKQVHLSKKQPKQDVPSDHFFVYVDYQQIKIEAKDILYIESMGDYIKIYLDAVKHPIVTLGRIKYFAEQLLPFQIKRIHRSYLVNVAKINTKQKTRIMVNDKWLPVGDSYRE
jgi:two-component system, LytTR family, response regulator